VKAFWRGEQELPWHTTFISPTSLGLLGLNVTFVRIVVIVTTFSLWLIVCTGGRFF